MKIKGNIGLIFMYVAVALVIISLVHIRATGTASANFIREEKTLKGMFTAYTADGAQTDSSPTITASNQKVQEGIIANNCLPFGTKIKVNGKIYEVQDRMHDRYGCDNFDIYMHDYSRAVNFGIRPLKYEII
jgi:3D (Asp-Asp-Asp) domain-containing protein